MTAAITTNTNTITTTNDHGDRNYKDHGCMSAAQFRGRLVSGVEKETERRFGLPMEPNRAAWFFLLHFVQRFGRKSGRIEETVAFCTLSRGNFC